MLIAQDVAPNIGVGHRDAIGLEKVHPLVRGVDGNQARTGRVENDRQDRGIGRGARQRDTHGPTFRGIGDAADPDRRQLCHRPVDIEVIRVVDGDRQQRRERLDVVAKFPAANRVGSAGEPGNGVSAITVRVGATIASAAQSIVHPDSLDRFEARIAHNPTNAIGSRSPHGDDHALGSQATLHVGYNTAHDIFAGEREGVADYRRVGTHRLVFKGPVVSQGFIVGIGGRHSERDGVTGRNVVGTAGQRSDDRRKVGGEIPDIDHDVDEGIGTNPGDSDRGDIQIKSRIVKRPPKGNRRVLNPVEGIGGRIQNVGFPLLSGSLLATGPNYLKAVGEEHIVGNGGAELEPIVALVGIPHPDSMIAGRLHKLRFQRIDADVRTDRPGNGVYG